MHIYLTYVRVEQIAVAIPHALQCERINEEDYEDSVWEKGRKVHNL
jgi:hypothetical protein